MVSIYTMIEQVVRTRVSEHNYSKTRKIVNFPESATFNDCLSELLRRHQEYLKKGEPK